MGLSNRACNPGNAVWFQSISLRYELVALLRCNIDAKATTLLMPVSFGVQKVGSKRKPRGAITAFQSTVEDSPPELSVEQKLTESKRLQVRVRTEQVAICMSLAKP